MSDIYLTNEFKEFSSKIAAIREEKTAREEEFKAVYAAFKKNISEIEGKATEAEETWNKFVEAAKADIRGAREKK